MNARRRGRKSSNRSRRRVPQPLELWKAVPVPDELEPISQISDPGAVLRSLGTPPLTGQNTVADQYLELAARRASATASALAKAAGLLIEDDVYDNFNTD